MISKINNEEGSVIVIALIILVLLTMTGIAATNNTVIELQIVRNEAIYRQNFYRAGAAVIEAAERLEDTVNTDDLIPLTTTYAWLKIDTFANADMTDLNNWKDGADPPNWPNINTASSNNMDDAADLRNNTKYAAISNGIAKGSSLSMTSGSNLYEYSVFGLFDSTSGQGQSLILSGYNKRF
ncbi:MAG: pilus assembly PilX family protein [Methanosarcinaceae archaeon]